MFENDNKTVVKGTVVKEQVDEALRQYMLKIYNYMSTGLAISGLVAWVVANVPAVQSLFYKMVEVDGRMVMQANVLGIIAMLAPLGLLIYGTFRANSLKVSSLQAIYWAFVALQGVGLAVILNIYTGESVVRALLVTAISFAGLSIYGYTTKRSLSAFGSFLMMGLFGLVIASVISIFWTTPAMQFMISIAGVFIFAGLTAYETQILRDGFYSGHSQEAIEKSAIFGALSLYLNFLNLLMFILRFMGDRR